MAALQNICGLEFLKENYLNFVGNFVTLNVREGNCLNINADSEAAAWSVQVSNKMCVTIFDQRNCQGEFWSVYKSIWDLSSVRFQQKARSMKSCGKYVAPTTISVTEASFNKTLGEVEHKKKTSGDLPSMFPLIILVIVSLVLVTGTILIVKFLPGVRDNISRVYVALRSRLVVDDANKEFFGGFRWEVDERSCEEEGNFARTQIMEAAESQLIFGN